MSNTSNSSQKSGRISHETKVGLLVAGTTVLVVAFAWLLGVRNPFQSSTRFYVTYNFAGGIEVGSPVRVSGIKVGKVEAIEFFSPIDPKTAIAVKEPGSAEETGARASVVPLKLKISIRSDAAKGIRKDSQFYVNIAGIIGERYIEVTPGSADAEVVKDGATLAGVDPPRIDQLISQSFDLAGKIKDLIEKNKGDITKSIELLYKLSANVNQTLTHVENSKIFKTDLQSLVNNLIQITKDTRTITDNFSTPEGKRTLTLLHDLLWRLEPLDSSTIRSFMQKEGIRARLF
ncbi:MAG: MCE family protein [Bdellovibrionales bacterium]|nr:MCE family protein [Bdellovibrionales bacterium]